MSQILDNSLYLGNTSSNFYFSRGTSGNFDIVPGTGYLNFPSGNIKLGQGIFYPAVDSTTAVSFKKANATTNVAVIDTLNGNVSVTGTGIFTDIYLPQARLGNSTYSTVNDFHNSFGSAGRKEGGTCANVGGGYISVASGNGFIKAADNDNAQLMFFNWATNTGILIPSDSMRYIGVIYNGGTPQVESHASFDWDLDTSFPLARVVNEKINNSDEIYISNNSWWVTDGTTNIIQVIRSFGLIRRDDSVGGLILSVPGTRNIKVTSGTVWSGLVDYSFTGIDTSLAGTIEAYWYKAGVGWQASDITQYSVTQWNDTTLTALQTISNNKYCNVWIYGEMTNTGPGVALVYPQAQYNTAAEAESVGAPTLLPVHIAQLGMLLGRVIIKQAIDAPVKTQSAFGTTFTASVVTDHNNLANLQGGTASQYNHLTNAEYSGNWDGKNISTTGLGSFSGLNISNYIAGTTGINLYSNNVNQLVLNSGNLYPFVDDSLNLGTANKGYKSFYLSKGNANDVSSEGEINYNNRTKCVSSYLGGMRQDFIGTSFIQTGNSTVANTTDETSVLGLGIGTRIFPSGFFTEGKTIRFKFTGFLSGKNTHTALAKIKLGDTLLASSTGTLGADMINTLWENESTFTCRTTGVNGSIIGQSRTLFGAGQGFATVTIRPLQMLIPVLLNTTTGNLLDATYTWGTADPDDSITTTNAILEVLN